MKYWLFGIESVWKEIMKWKLEGKRLKGFEFKVKWKKLKKNETKYPVEKAKSQHTKYNKL